MLVASASVYIRYDAVVEKFNMFTPCAVFHLAKLKCISIVFAAT